MQEYHLPQPPQFLSLPMIAEEVSKETQFLFLVEQIEKELKLDEEEKMMVAELHHRRRCLRLALPAKMEAPRVPED